MFPVSYYVDRYYTLGPLILLALVFLIMTTYLKSWQKVTAQYLSWIAITTGLACCIMSTLYSFFTSPLSLFLATYPFYGIYVAFTFLSVYIPLHTVIKQKEKECLPIRNKLSTVYVISIGYFFATATIAVGVAVSILRSYTISGFSTEESRMIGNIIINLLLYSVWPLVLVNLILLSLVYKDLIHATRKALITFNALTIVAGISQTVLTEYSFLSEPYVLITLFIVDLPNVMAISLWFFSSNLTTNFFPVAVDNPCSESSYEG